MKQIFLFGYFNENPSLLHSKRSYFERLAHELIEWDISLAVHDASPVKTSMRLPDGSWHRHHSIQPFDYAACDPGTCPPDEAEKDGIRLFAEFQTGTHDETYSTACLRLFRHYKRYLERERPDLVLYWNSFSPFHRWLRQVCQQLGIPALTAEGCPVPGMVEFDPVGSLGLGWGVRRNDDFNRLPLCADAFKRISEFLQSPDALHMMNKHRQPENSVEMPKLARPVLFIAGSSTYGAGLFPRWHPDSHCNSPIFSDDSDLIQALTPLAKRNNWSILYKPHPNNRKTIMESDAVTILDAVSATACMEACDVLLTLISSMAVQALLCEIPCLLLGRTSLWGKGCCLHIDSREQLGTAIEQALAEGFTSSMREAWLAYAVRAASWHAFSYSAETDIALGRSPRVASSFLHSFMQNPSIDPFPFPRTCEAS